MRTSQSYLFTKKEKPADAVVISHQLMLKAGLIRKLASGLYTWLPLGLRVLRKVEAIIREEMNKSGAQEVLMPAVQPGELWQETDRWDQFGLQLLKLKDRHQRDFVLGPTHEEVITDIVRNEINSYKQLPCNFYQLQNKFRDEIRPRFGVMRGREFLMKDAYSFHIHQDCLRKEYLTMRDTYCRIFDRLGLNYRIVEADSGAIGGSASHEVHVLAESGEDLIVFSDQSDYAANIEKAKAMVSQNIENSFSKEMMEVATPNISTIEQLVSYLSVDITKTVKTILVKTSENSEHPAVALLVRGDHTLNEIKAQNLPEVANPIQWVNCKEAKELTGASFGSIGPVGLNIPCIVDKTVAQMSNFVVGANKDGFHLSNVNWNRDVNLSQIADLRNVVRGDPSPCGQGKLVMKKGIEVGHLFQLGDKYSHAMNATVLDKNGRSQSLLMGCYGIGVTRIVAAAIEQHHDDKGIIWPESISPYHIAIIGVKYEKSNIVKITSDQLYQELTALGHEVILDDRKASLGVKFADMDLIGIPHRIVISDKGIKEGMLEYKSRQSHSFERIRIEKIVDFCQQKLKMHF